MIETYYNKVTLSLTPLQRLGDQVRNCKMDYSKRSLKLSFFSPQVNLAMNAISECCKTGEGNLLDLAVKVSFQRFLFGDQLM